MESGLLSIQVGPAEAGRYEWDGGRAEARRYEWDGGPAEAGATNGTRARLMPGAT
jgi:hypothetical protein